MIPPLLRLLDTEVDHISQLSRLEPWLDKFRGSFSMAVTIKNRVHLWRKGPGSFVVIAKNAEEDAEEVLYPLGPAFKTPSDTVKYTTVKIGLDALIVYCSASVIDRIHLHDLLGMALHTTDDIEGLTESMQAFFGMIKSRARGTGGDSPIGGSTVFRVFQLSENNIKPQLPRNRQCVRSPRSFRIWSIDSDDEDPSTRETRESDISLGPQFHNFLRQDDPLWSIMNESEASFDDNDLVSSDENEFEETMFERRRWWVDTSENSRQSESNGYDSSMTQGFFYPQGSAVSSVFSGYTIGNQFHE
jgi:hypothetical protein